MNATLFVTSVRKVTHSSQRSRRKLYISLGLHDGKRFFYDDKKDLTMPKDQSTRILQMQALRLRAKAKAANFSSSQFSLTVLGSGKFGAARSLYVGTDHVKYLFNCGEGTQRLAHEYKQRLAKVEHLLVTNASWNNIGGTPGMILTIQNEGSPALMVHGPNGTMDVFNAMKKFVALNDLQLTQAECDESEPFKDQNITISYVPIPKPYKSDLPCNQIKMNVEDDVEYYAYENTAKRKRKSREKKKVSKVAKSEVPSKVQTEGIMSYICKVPEKVGKLNLGMCVEKGVPAGPLMGQLKAGEDITLPDGTVVKSTDVCSPSQPPQFFLVVECPSEEYLNAFVDHPAFEKHQATAPEDDVARCVVHFSPPEIMSNPRYKDWMKRFGPTTEHLIINEANCGIESEAVQRHQNMLHLIHPEIFPILGETALLESNEDQSKNNRDTIHQGEENLIVHQAKTMQSFHLYPATGLSTENSVVIKPKEYIQEALNVEGFLDALADHQTEVNARTKTLNNVSVYPKIVMLGTGSSIPNKARNTSGILLRINENSSVILDCGEGTLAQLIRFYGPEKAKEVLSTVKAVYVSHLHADHHIGFIGLLQGTSRYTDKPLFLVAPKTIETWLRVYDAKIQSIFHKLTLIPNCSFMSNNQSPHEMHNELYESLNIREIRTVLVDHCNYAYGISITLNDGKRIVYSGDTMPCNRLIELGKGCDLLIHEATMEDDLRKEATTKRHSTFSDAINVGLEMNAGFILLTHFSQRYAKVPLLPDHEAVSKNVGVAHDNMEFSLSQLPLLPLLYPCQKILFSEFLLLIQKRIDKRHYTALLQNQ